MGTSTSCKGGGSNSPFDPEWLNSEESDDATSEEPDTTVGDGDAMATDEDAAPDETGAGVAVDHDDLHSGEPDPASPSDGASGAGIGIAELGASAPDRRFARARTQLSSYFSRGGKDSLRAAVKSMVNKGMGGPRRAASTMRRTALGAGQLGYFLAAARNQSDPRVVDWVQRVRAANLSAHDLILELIREVLPETGSVDEESLRNAAAEALGQLYEDAPDVDIFNLSDSQIADVIGSIIANDVCNRMDLLLGQTYERLKFDAREVQLQRNDQREYVNEVVRIELEQHGALKVDPRRLAQEVLASSLRVFAQ